ncbi:MAG: esterase/lipase family protein [Woeseiaceae bacterium]
MRFKIDQMLAVLLVLSLAGCANSDKSFLAINYQRAAQIEGPDRNPVLVVPGLLGTTLRDTRNGELVWGGYDGVSVDPSKPNGLRALALPLSPAADGRVNDDDAIEPTWVLERAHVKLLGLPFNLNVYAGILQALGAGGYRDESLGTAGVIDYGPGHFTCFQFPYDWRRDIVESAKKLSAFIETKKQFVANEYEQRFGIKTDDIKFDIVAHSMGGLVVRYYLMYGDQDLPKDGSLPELNWAGAKQVERVILVGTPNAGSALTVRNLLNGLSLGFLQPTYTPTLLGTYPSTYQLLPRAKSAQVVWADSGKSVGDLFDPELWKQNRWGLASDAIDPALEMLLPDQTNAAERRKIALSFQSRLLARAKQFQAAIDRPHQKPDELQMMMVIGDNRATASQISVDRTTATAAVTAFEDGDGTVLRSSVLHDVREDKSWQPALMTPLDYDQVLFLPEKHTALTDSATFTDNILYWLLEDPRP